MPRTIDEGFRDFHTKLTPSSFESDAAKAHRESIKRRIEKDFGLRRFWRIGSFGNGTSIREYSDVDYMACIPTASLSRNSSTFLTKLRNSLAERFPYTGVRTSCPAVAVPFGSSAKETTEVVPGDLLSTSPYHVYDIPNCSGGWMKTSPDAHNAYVRKINKKHGLKVKPLIRYIKAWKYYRFVRISSFYLEMRVAKYCEGESSIIYSLDIEYFLHRMLIGNLARIQDPAGVSGYISPCSSQANHDDAVSKLKTAVRRAENANKAEEDEDIKTAFDWWDKLYAYEFPSYYK